MATSASVPCALALKIRTLDQKTYPIVISSDASVPQLKEIIAIETGIGLPRQRLIFRGKVLKDDQQISAYALEEGHVLHLVARPEDAAATTTEPPPQPQRQERQHSSRRTGTSRGSHGGASGTTLRNNDDPDPTFGSAPHNHSHVVMGATIAVPDDIPMPFLSSMISNFMNSMGAEAVNGDLQGDDPLQVQRSRDVMRRLRRGRHATEDGAAATPRRRGRHASNGNGTSTGENSAMSGTMLRDFADNHLRRLESSLSNPVFALPEIQPREEGQGMAQQNREDALIAEQLRQLQAHITQFTPRMERMPPALREIAWYAQQGQEAPHALVSSTVRAIDSLQNVGDAATSIARFARHVFLSNSPDIPPPLLRVDNQGTLRASMSFPMMVPMPQPPTGTITPQRSHRERSQPPASSASTETTATNTADQQAQSPGVLRSLYQRVTSGLLGGSSQANAGGTTVAAESSAQPAQSTNRPTADGNASGSDVNHFTISAHAVPFHPFFPFPVSYPAGMMSQAPTNRPEWDVAGLWRRLTGDLRAFTAFGILSGDPASLHELMRSLATIFVSGLYTPPISSMAIRLWARRFLISTRRVLREQTFPSNLLQLLPDRDQARLIEEITRPLDPFMPELIDHIRRSTAASQADAFGRSCTEFLRNMATQFLLRMRAYVGDDAAQVTQLLEGILMSLNVERGLASYVVARLLEFASPADRTRRPDANLEAAPESKRRRVD